jgi:hypothetical protein
VPSLSAMVIKNGQKNKYPIVHHAFSGLKPGSKEDRDKW